MWDFARTVTQGWFILMFKVLGHRDIGAACPLVGKFLKAALFAYHKLI